MPSPQKADTGDTRQALNQTLSNVFICYAPEDFKFITSLSQAFDRHKQKIWLKPRDAQLTADQQNELLHRIETAEYFIFIVSPDSVKSETCLRELAHAAEYKKHLIPLLYRSIDADGLPAQLKNLEEVSFLDEGKFKDSFEVLLKKIDPILRFEAFISYSRKDQLFVQTLANALLNNGRKTWIDRRDLQPTEPWMQAIKSGIEVSDNFIFVLSPHSITSTVCQAELTHAIENRKRIVPVVVEDVDDEKVAKEVSDPNWIYFRPTDDFEESFNLLIKALDTDLDYVHEHSRLQIRALEWERSGRGGQKPDKSLLLRGQELRNARQWLAKAELGKKPEPTSLHKTFIRVSRRTALRRQVFTSATVIASLSLIAFLIYVIGLRTSTINQQTRIANARMLVNQANLIWTQQGNLLPRNALFALAAIRQNRSLEAEQALRQSLSLLPLRTASMKHEAKVNDLAFSPDGNYLATAAENGAVQLWNTTTSESVWAQNPAESAEHVCFSGYGKYLAAANLSLLTVWELSSKQPVLSFTHNERITSVNFDPTERYVATSEYGSEGEVRVWDLANGKLVWHKQLNTVVIAATFSPDGAYLATATFEQPVLIFDATTGRSITSLNNDLGAPAFAFNPKRKEIVTVSAGKARLWEIPTGRKKFEVSHGTYAGAVAFSPDGTSFATGDQDGSIRLWDANSGTELKSLKHGEDVSSLYFSPDSQYLASVGSDSTVRVWHTDDGLEVARMFHPQEIKAAAFSSNGQLLATACADGVARVWESVSSFERAVRYKNSVKSVRFSPHGQYLVSKREDLSASIQRTVDGKVHWSWPFSAVVSDIQFDPAEKYFAVAGDAAGTEEGASRHSVVEVVQLADGKEVATLNHGFLINVIAFGNDGKSLVSHGYNGDITMWDISSETKVWSHNTTGVVTAIAFSPDGKSVVTVGDMVSVRSALNGQVIREFRPTEQIAVMSFSSDGSLIALGGGEGGVFLFAPGSGETRHLRSYGGFIVGITITADDEYVASADFGGDATLIEISAGNEVAKVTFPDAIMSMAISPDARYVTAAGGSIARVFEFTTGQEVARIVHGAEVKSVDFSPDGKYLASGGSDNTVRISLLQTEDLVAEACRRLINKILPSENYTGEAISFETCSPPPQK